MSTISAKDARPLDVVMLHGGWHCGSSWGPVVPALQARGHHVLTPDLPGHGWRARYPEGYFLEGQPGLATQRTTADEITLKTAADVVTAALTGLRAASAGERSTVLVSHSSTGAIASLVAERSPDLVDHLVYVAAIVPSKRRSAYEFAALPEYGSPTMDGLLVGDPMAIGAMRINPRSTDPQYRELLREKFYTDLTPAAADPFIDLLCPDQPVSYLAEPVTVTPERWGSVARTYVKTTNDRSIAPAIQDIIMQDADDFTPGNHFRRVPMETSHSPFASQPEAFADVVTEAGANTLPRKGGTSWPSQGWRPRD